MFNIYIYTPDPTINKQLAICPWDFCSTQRHIGEQLGRWLPKFRKDGKRRWKQG